MIFDSPPKGFKPKSEVVGSLVECNNKILLMKRNDVNEYWAQPAGGKENGETLLQAVIRETLEETGIKMEPEEVRFLRTFYVRYPSKDFIFSVFRYTLKRRPTIRMCQEHSEFKWVTPKEALSLNLIPDEDICLKEIYFI